MCEASRSYTGASKVNECMFRDDLTCQSKGPDLVAGAVHMLSERLDLLDFSISYYTVRQITIKKGKPLIPDIMKTFKCFDESLWFLGIFMEIGNSLFLFVKPSCYVALAKSANDHSCVHYSNGIESAAAVLCANVFVLCSCGVGANPAGGDVEKPAN